MRNFFRELINTHGPQGNYNDPELLVPGGCTDLVRIVWPNGAGFMMPAGDNPIGGPPLPNIFVPLTDTWQLVKCIGTTCCKFVNFSNGQGTSTTVPEIECQNAIRDPDWTPTRGVFTGTVVSTTGCKPSCGNNVGSGSFTTNINKETQPIKLISSPTLVTDKIYFTSQSTIRQVRVYDIKGKKVKEQEMNSDELNLVDLTNGIYYIQLLFDNNEISTIKIYKD